MFTGIIEDLGNIEATEKKGGILRIRIKSNIFIGQKIGDSIAINGACLTISNLKSMVAGFDVIEETLGKTNLASLKCGDKVNLERALKVGDRVGGHFVTGHIDCVAKILEKRREAGNYLLRVALEKENARYVVEKGSIALDGISLTVAAVTKDSFSVYLIPHTVKNTTLAFRDIGNALNCEFDMLGKYALDQSKRKEESSRITEEFLRQKGFS